MKYKAQFDKAWKGTWIFDAADDIKAWEAAIKKAREHVQVVVVGIEAIFELDDNGNTLRKLPRLEDCLTSEQTRKKPESLDKTAIYKAYFSNGECSAPFVTIIAGTDATDLRKKIKCKIEREKAFDKKFDAIALELAEHKLQQHIAYNALDSEKIKIVQVEQLNDNMHFIVNRERKTKKENRFLIH